MASSGYNQTPSSFVSTSPPTFWEVFISFRGKDTRHTFTDHLYNTLIGNGIVTYRDTPELRSGNSRTLPQAIKESKTYVVVLSKEFAHLHWCLDELVEILDYHERFGRLVIPVFYNIDAAVVRHQIKSFKDAFDKHKLRYAGEMERVNNWRRALTEFADFSGEPVGEKRYEASIVNKIVDRILQEISPKTLYVAKYPVGLDSRAKDITTFLRSDTKRLTRIGIYGMGGVGKTTLALHVYNKNYHRFKGSCFLADVRKVSKTDEGLVCLQQQLIDNVLKRKNDKINNIHHGVACIKDRLCSTKALIVIDDLDDPKPLEYLGALALGSIIIITTRNEDLLDLINVEDRYKVNELGGVESRQLFTQHAFENNIISDTLMKLSDEILERAGGLPLALTIFGSDLLNKSDKEYWTWFIDELIQVSITKVEKELLISFNGLKLGYLMLQNIFLDIACFFMGLQEEKVAKIMETHYMNVNSNIDILKKRSLLSINNGDELRMHDLLRDMGRNIARNNFRDEPGKHSRLWVSKDICDVLKKRKGTDAIEGIIPHNLYYQDSLKGVSFTTDTFRGMSKLRFLYLKNVNLTGSFEETFDALRWLCWECCPLKCLPSEFHPQKLVTLALPRSEMRTMWEVPQDFEELTSLNMSDSPNLTTTPGFTRLQNLVSLNLEGCKSLEEVHVSIGSLKSLVYLILCGCVELKSLPDTICDLQALQSLNIGGCSSLEALPIKLGNIKSLKELNAERLTVSKLPDSIGCLSNLVELKIGYNTNLKTLPDSICDLKALKVLNFGYCRTLKALPINLGNMESLKELYAEGLTVSKFPDSIRYLSKLVELRLSYNENLESLPNTICYLTSLKILEISRRKKLVKVTRLGEVDSSGVRDCRHLLSMAELPPNLKRISADGCTSMERLPNLSNLKQLEILNLTGCSGLAEIQGLEELTSIRILHLTGCSSTLLASTLTKHFFQIYSAFGHQIRIYAEEFPNWISQSRNIVSTNLLQNASHDFLGMILCFKHSTTYSITYSVKNITSDFLWSDESYNSYHKSLMVMVPNSIFSVKDGDDRIELTTGNAECLGIHLLYKTEMSMIDEYDTTTINVYQCRNGRSYPSKQAMLLESDN